MPELESGKVRNERTTTKKAETSSGTVTEKVVQDKDTNEITEHTVTDQEGTRNVKKEEKPKILQYHPSNGEFILIKLLEMIKQQNTEQSYYLRKIAQKLDVVDDDELRKLLGIKDGGSGS